MLPSTEQHLRRKFAGFAFMLSMKNSVFFHFNANYVTCENAKHCLRVMTGGRNINHSIFDDAAGVRFIHLYTS